ncbi:hypothetical protein MJ560_02525 [Klebsiella pneumoniae]|nr:hypothetical protein MJ560_02525 [Klebsiella pneumoniae]
MEIVPEELGFSVNIGELLLTECEMVNGFVAPQNQLPPFTHGYGPDLRRERAQSDGHGASVNRCATGAGL